MQTISPIQLLPVHRDADGWWSHPDYLSEFDDEITEDQFNDWCVRHQVETKITCMESDVDADVFDTYMNDGQVDCSAWEIQHPAEPGWFILSIHDAEDGPVCIWGRRKIHALTKEELAAQLDGIQYPAHRAITKEHIAAAKAAGLVIVYGASDDQMEFDGASREEIGCYNGGYALVDPQGVLPDRDCLEGDDEIAEYVQRKKLAKTVEALWSAEHSYSWTYKTAIPHATFEVMEGGDRYCRGIVFSLADLGPQVSP